MNYSIALDATEENYNLLIDSYDKSKDIMFFPPLEELQKRNIKLMTHPIAIDHSTNQRIDAISLGFKTLKEINLDHITHFYGICAREYGDGLVEFIFRGKYEMDGYELSKYDVRFIKLSVNLSVDELEPIIEKLKTLDITNYGQYLNEEYNKLNFNF